MPLPPVSLGRLTKPSAFIRSRIRRAVSTTASHATPSPRLRSITIWSAARSSTFAFQGCSSMAHFDEPEEPFKILHPTPCSLAAFALFDAELVNGLGDVGKRPLVLEGRAVDMTN